MRSGYVSNRVNHRKHDQTKCECYTNVCHSTAANLINDDRARAGEDQGEGSDELRSNSFHSLQHA